MVKYAALSINSPFGDRMKLRDILEILSARVLVEHQGLDGEIPMAGAADLMSDVLAFGSEGMMLMTGLTNPQVVRTAEMAGINVVVFVRDKTPPPETVELAKDSGITILITRYTMYEACGRLYQAGLPGLGPVKIENDTW
ncbi:MAG TPA: hypothetical protein VMC85_10415 [Desulfomonilaceae bacterium]|nr:hypothetical protein [Desulfomonilaceae bacterium]